MGTKFPWPDPGAVGDITEQQAYRIFKIQAIWAYPAEPDKTLRWGSYYAHAYRDRRTGKPFEEAHADVCKVPERVGWGDGLKAQREHHEGFAFTTLQAAEACMARLREHAEWNCDYETNADWAVSRRGRPIRFRVVEINFAKLVTVAAV